MSNFSSLKFQTTMFSIILYEQCITESKFNQSMVVAIPIVSHYYPNKNLMTYLTYPLQEVGRGLGGAGEAI